MDQILSADINFSSLQDSMGNLFKVLKIRQTKQHVKELTVLEEEIIHMIRFTTFFGDIIKTPLDIG